MADLAIGLSTKVVDGLVKKVEGAIKEEQEQWQIVERDSVFIKGEFEMMKSFLKSADRDRVRNNVGRTWVRQVRDLSYDAEDCMDDVLELEPSRPWWALPFWPRLLPPCCRPRVGQALDEAVNKIKLIKARVEEVSHRNKRYNLINTTGSGKMQQAATAMDMVDLDMAKVEEGSSRLRDLLGGEARDGGRLSVIFVWGTGGNLGAISVIRNVFDNPNARPRHKLRAWVKLMHPFSPQKFLRDLVAQFGASTYGDDVWSKMEKSSVNLDKEVVVQQLKGCAYFLVLEDLSNMADWDIIRTYLPDEADGSWVIVSTQHQHIARLCIGQPQRVEELSQVSADHCVYALFRVPSELNQGSTGVPYLSAIANYWNPSHSNRRADKKLFDRAVKELFDRISSYSERPSRNDTDVLAVSAPDATGKAVMSKVCLQWLFSNKRDREDESNTNKPPSFELYGWIDMVVDQPFHVPRFSRILYSVLRPDSCYDDSTGDPCLSLLTDHRCLVVINGLKKTEDWRALDRAGLIYGHPNSCIVVVTSDESVASAIQEGTPAAVHYKIRPQLQDGLAVPTAGIMGGPCSPSAASSGLLLKDFAKHWNKEELTGRDEELCQLYDMVSSSTPLLTVWGPSGVDKKEIVAKVYSYYYLLSTTNASRLRFSQEKNPSPFQLYGWVDVSSNSNPSMSHSNSDPSMSLMDRLLSYKYVLSTVSKTKRLLSYKQPQLKTDDHDVTKNKKSMSLSNSDPSMSLADIFSETLLSYMQPQLKKDNLKTDDHDEAPRPNGDRACELLTRQSCLVVIEGLQSEEDCKKLIDAKLIGNGHPKSCTILITEKESVATYAKIQQKLQVRPLPTPTRRNLDKKIEERNLDDITSLFRMANLCSPKYSTIIGRDNEVGRLSKMISDQDGTTPVVVVWGPPGVGKTALVAKVYSQFVLNHRSATRQPFERFGWVQVSNPFNLMSFSRSLLSVLRPEAPQSPDPIRDCANLVQKDTSLVVIDGLRSMENYDELMGASLIFNRIFYSCCILITRDRSVATSIASKLRKVALFQVKPLDGPSAKDLFTQVYQRERRGRNSSSINGDDLLCVADKCCGLPIVILAVAKYLSRLPDDQVKQFTAAGKDGKFIHELATKRGEFVGLKGLLDWVESDLLKACSESLKLLIMYMLHFCQESVVVRRKRLVWRWIAEGYIKNTGICDMVTEAEQRVRELQDLTIMMMQVLPGPGPGVRHRGYQLGFSGQVLMSKEAQDPLFLPLEVSALTEGNKQGSLLTSSTGRHLRIDGKWERDEFVFRSLDLSRLRSLTVSGRWEPFFISDSMRVLRVLDLEGTQGIKSDHLKEIHKQLPRLRFLSLRGCRDIERLPDSIGKLRQLQTLDIKGTKITRLPNCILKLRNLQCLRAGQTMKAQTETRGDPCTPRPWRRRRRIIISRLRGLASCPWQTTPSNASPGVTMPRGMMSQLTALHTLGIVNVSTAGLELATLKHLKQLRKLQLYGINSCNVRGLRHLRSSLDSLSLGFAKDCGDDAASSSSSSVKVGLSGFASRQSFRLKLHGHAGSLEVFPDGARVTDLTSRKQPRVRNLYLDVHTGTKLKFDANDDKDGGFHQLKHLEITSCLDGDAAQLQVDFARGDKDNETLKVLKLVGSMKIPTGLNHLRSLKEVWIEEGQTQAMRDVLKEHPKHNNVKVNALPTSQ